MRREEIERKQRDRWEDWQREIPMPLTEKTARLLDLPVLTADALRLLKVAILTDVHLQRPGAAGDLPVTHSAYISGFQELYLQYLADRPTLTRRRVGKEG